MVDYPGNTWQQIINETISGDTDFSVDLTTSNIAVIAEFSTTNPALNRAGYLRQRFYHPDLGEVVHNRSRLLYLNRKVFLDLIDIYPSYRLRFEPLPWIDPLTIKVWMPEMSIYPEQNNSGGTSYITSTTNVLNTAVRVAVTNINRQDIIFANPANSGAIIYLGMDNTVSTNSPIRISAGQSWKCDINWDGEFWAISNKTTATALGVTEIF